MSFVVRNRILLQLVLCAVVWLFKMFPVCLHLSYVGREAVWSRAAHRQVEAGGCTCVGMLAKQLKSCKWSIILISLREQKACSLCLLSFAFLSSCFSEAFPFQLAASCSCAGMATATAMLRPLAMLQAHTRLIHYYKDWH